MDQQVWGEDLATAGQKESERMAVSLLRYLRHQVKGSGTVVVAKGSIDHTTPFQRSIIWAKKSYDARWPPLMRETS
jgi:hypothetical protein